MEDDYYALEEDFYKLESKYNVLKELCASRPKYNVLDDDTTNFNDLFIAWLRKIDKVQEDN